MEQRIRRHLIQILSYRTDLLDNIKPFLENLKNNNTNETFRINEEQFIPFINSFPKFQLETLHNHGVINEEKYTSLVR